MYDLLNQSARQENLICCNCDIKTAAFKDLDALLSLPLNLRT